MISPETGLLGLRLGWPSSMAATCSGSLITARGKFGRLVFAAPPGSPLDPHCHGINPDDGVGTSLLPPDETDRVPIADALGPVEIDDIVRHTGLTPAAVYLVPLGLDILHRHTGGLVSLAMDA